MKWEVRSLGLIRERVIPHFRDWPLLSAKQVDFESFASICERMGRQEHRTNEGLIEIVRIAASMNPSGKRRFEPGRIITELSR